MPPDLRSTSLSSFPKNTTLKIALVAPAPNLGDVLISRTALSVWIETIAQQGIQAEVDILCRIPVRTEHLFRPLRCVNQIKALPVQVREWIQYDATATFSDINFHKNPMFESYAERLGMDPKTIPSKDKRIQLTVSSETQQKIRHQLPDQRPFLLFNPYSSSVLRSIPLPDFKTYIDLILDQSPYHIVSTGPINYTHPRFTSLYDLSTANFENFAGIISEMDAIITVDTSVFHIAAAFDIPTAVIFTCIDPDLRIKDYPTVKGIQVWRPQDAIKPPPQNEKNEVVEAYSLNAWSYVNIPDTVSACLNMLDTLLALR